jgi:hypothetical protein
MNIDDEKDVELILNNQDTKNELIRLARMKGGQDFCTSEIDNSN